MQSTNKEKNKKKAYKENILYVFRIFISTVEIFSRATYIYITINDSRSYIYMDPTCITMPRSSSLSGLTLICPSVSAWPCSFHRSIFCPCFFPSSPQHQLHSVGTLTRRQELRVLRASSQDIVIIRHTHRERIRGRSRRLFFLLLTESFFLLCPCLSRFPLFLAARPRRHRLSLSLIFIPCYGCNILRIDSRHSPRALLYSSYCCFSLTFSSAVAAALSLRFI